MIHLGYQNILQLPKVADGIDVKRSIQGKVFDNYKKADSKGNRLMNLGRSPKTT